MRYALVDKETNKVKNVIAWDGRDDTWNPPKDCYAVELPGEQLFGIGDSYDPDKKEWVMNEDRKGKYVEDDPENPIGGKNLVEDVKDIVEDVLP